MEGERQKSQIEEPRAGIIATPASGVSMNSITYPHTLACASFSSREGWGDLALRGRWYGCKQTFIFRLQPLDHDATDLFGFAAEDDGDGFFCLFSRGSSRSSSHCSFFLCE